MEETDAALFTAVMSLNRRSERHQCGSFSRRRLRGGGCYGYGLSQRGLCEG